MDADGGTIGAERQPQRQALGQLARFGENIAPAFTSESGREAGKRSGEARKGKRWSWEQRAAAIVRRRGPDGERTHDTVLKALVQKCLEGDPKAVELLARVSGWKPESVKRVEGSLRRELAVRFDSPAAPAPVIDVQASAPSVPASQETSATSDVVSPVALRSGHSAPTAEPEQPTTPRAEQGPSEAWTDGTD